MSDTVGFIRKLPHSLVASFRTTLNVVSDADLILHVVDLSNPVFREHIKVVSDTLAELHCEKTKTITIFNKVDQVNDNNFFDNLKSEFPDAVFVSASRAINILELKEKIRKVYEENFVEEEIEIPVEKSKLISQIHSLATVSNIEYGDEVAVLKIRTDKNNFAKLKKLLL